MVPGLEQLQTRVQEGEAPKKKPYLCAIAVPEFAQYAAHLFVRGRPSLAERPVVRQLGRIQRLVEVDLDQTQILPGFH